MVGPSLPVISSSVPVFTPAQDDVHRRIVEEAIEAVLSTVDLHSVLDRTGQLLRRHFGETRRAPPTPPSPGPPRPPHPRPGEPPAPRGGGPRPRPAAPRSRPRPLLPARGPRQDAVDSDA